MVSTDKSFFLMTADVFASTSWSKSSNLHWTSKSSGMRAACLLLLLQKSSMSLRKTRMHRLFEELVHCKQMSTNTADMMKCQSIQMCHYSDINQKLQDLSISPLLLDCFYDALFVLNFESWFLWFVAYGENNVDLSQQCVVESDFDDRKSSRRLI